MMTGDIINATTPTNIKEEKTAFFSSSTYNPQLSYKAPIPLEELTVWGKPKPEITQHALHFLTTVPAIVPTDTSDFIQEQDVIEAIDAFNQQYQPEPPIELIFSENLVAKCKVGRQKIYFHQPLRYNYAQFADLRRHELETHLLRILNHTQQPWAEYEVPEVKIRRTEEGWAGLHTFLYRDDKVIRKSYVTYMAVSMAQQFSFREVFNKLRELGVSKELSWRIALRTKRGLTDTSQPGGLTRDICYLEGAIMVWDWLINRNNDPHDCYLGRLSLDDIPVLKPQADISKIKYPSFLQNPDEYLTHIKTIGEVNQFGNLI